MPLKASLLRLCMEIVQFMFTVKRSFIYRVDIKYWIFPSVSACVRLTFRQDRRARRWQAGHRLNWQTSEKLQHLRERIFDEKPVFPEDTYYQDI